jgi:hypothetical protein
MDVRRTKVCLGGIVVNGSSRTADEPPAMLAMTMSLKHPCALSYLAPDAVA